MELKHYNIQSDSVTKEVLIVPFMELKPVTSAVADALVNVLIVPFMELKPRTCIISLRIDKS